MPALSKCSYKNSYIPPVFGQLGYLIAESFRSFRQHRTVILPSLVTLFLCSLLLSACLVALLGTFRLLSVEKSLYTVEVFLKAPVKGDSLESLRSHFLKFKQIDSVIYVSPEMAMENFRVNFSGDMLSLVDGNPLPASFRLSFRDDYRTPAELHGLLDALQRENAYDEVQAPTGFVDKVSAWKFSLVFWPVAVSLLLLVTLALIIGNAVKLSLFSRKLLVENMKYAGGSPFFIECPFVLEGAMQGFFGSIGASLLLAFLLREIRAGIPVTASYLEGAGWILTGVIIGVTAISAYFSFRSVRGFLTREDPLD